MLPQHVRPSVHAVVRAGAQDVHVVRRVVDLAEGETVGDLGESAFVAAIQECAQRRGMGGGAGRRYPPGRREGTVSATQVSSVTDAGGTAGFPTGDGHNLSIEGPNSPDAVPDLPDEVPGPP